MVPRRQVRHLHALGAGDGGQRGRPAAASGMAARCTIADTRSSPITARSSATRRRSATRTSSRSSRPRSSMPRNGPSCSPGPGRSSPGRWPCITTTSPCGIPQVTPWNSVKMGPQRDITGELDKAYRARGLKFITTFHHGFAWRYYEPAFAFDAADGKNCHALHRTARAEGPAVEAVPGPVAGDGQRGRREV